MLFLVVKTFISAQPYVEINCSPKTDISSQRFSMSRIRIVQSRPSVYPNSDGWSGWSLCLDSDHLHPPIIKLDNFVVFLRIDDGLSFNIVWQALNKMHWKLFSDINFKSIVVRIGFHLLNKICQLALGNFGSGKCADKRRLISCRWNDLRIILFAFVMFWYLERRENKADKSFPLKHLSFM